MPVYEATEKTHHTKILRFINSLPEESFPKRCWRSGTEELTFEELSRLKQGLEVFVVEDDKSRIRAVAAWQRRGAEWNPKEPKITTGLIFIMDNDDFTKENTTYMQEFIEWAIPYQFKNGIELGEYFIGEKFMPMFLSCCKDAVEVLRDVDTPIGKMFLVHFHFRKYLES